MRTPTEYEQFVQQVIEELSADGIVVHHAREFVGRISGRTIITDVAFDLKVAGAASVLILVECKRYCDESK